MKLSRISLPLLCFLMGASVTSSCVAQNPPAAPMKPLSAATLLSFDFDTNSWPGATTSAVGTIDIKDSTQPSSGLSAEKLISSGPLAIQNSETNLGKLTLAFSLSASSNQPVTVRVESFDKNKKRTGGLETQISPAAPDFYQRYALDLDKFKPSGAGKFQPNAPFVGFSFQGDGEIRLDNVDYAKPAFYVSPIGQDSNDGRSEKTAFATPQKALDMAQPGDIIVLMNGTYRGELKTVASFPRAGTPAAWIVLKNYPGQTPTLSGNGWNIVHISKGSREETDTTTNLAYLEVRGLHVRGEGDVAATKYADALGKSDGRTNTNGITVEGRFMKNRPHHIRFADNLVEFCPAQGLGSIEGDSTTIENNVSRNNCWTTIYATSGISVMGAFNFDASDNVYKQLIRNNICSGNETKQIWQEVGRISDGNGIILDVNQKPNYSPDGSYAGRTLVQSNLCYNNGGSGIHTVRADRVDSIGNTAYMNSASKALQYPQIYGYSSRDVRIINNILVAPVANVAAGEKPEPVNKSGGPPDSNQITFSHNLYFGGNIAPTMGEGDQIGDPMFVNPALDANANFHLKAGSPALGMGKTMPFSPFLDLDGKPRGAKPNLGAY